MSDSGTAMTALNAIEIPGTTERPMPPSFQSYPIPPAPNPPVTTEDPTFSVKMDMAKDDHIQPRTETIRGHSSSTPKPDIKIESRGRSPSPPKGPRGSIWQRTSKSPPKGPRNQGASTPSMVHTPITAPVPILATGPMYPTGPRADRRPKDPNVDLPPLRSLEFVKITPPSGEKWAKASQQLGPKGRYGVSQLEVDVSLFFPPRFNTILIGIHLLSLYGCGPAASTPIKITIRYPGAPVERYTNWMWLLLIYVWLRLEGKLQMHSWRKPSTVCLERMPRPTWHPI